MNVLRGTSRPAGRGLDGYQERRRDWIDSGLPSITAPKSVKSRRARVSLKDAAWFSEQMAVTQASGIPLYRALAMLAKLRSETPLGRLLQGLQRRVGDGESLSQAMDADRELWGATLCSLVAAGEASGSLDQAFARAAAMLSTRLGLRRKIVGALVYPAAVLTITVALVGALVFFVVPRFKDIYDSLGSELPTITQVVVSLSSRAPILAVALVVVLVAAVAVLRLARRNDALGMRVDRVKLGVPVLGSLIAKGVHARVASTVSSLISSGVPLLEALEFAADAAGSRPYRDALFEVKRRLADGSTFSAALEQTELWPDLMVQLVAVGEEAGSLPTMMERYAGQSVSEVDAAATSLTKLIEPLLMVVIGGVVGVFLLALYLPIFDLGSQLR